MDIEVEKDIVEKAYQLQERVKGLAALVHCRPRVGFALLRKCLNDILRADCTVDQILSDYSPRPSLHDTEARSLPARATKSNRGLSGRPESSARRGGDRRESARSLSTRLESPGKVPSPSSRRRVPGDIPVSRRSRPRCWEATRPVGGLPRIADEPPRPVSCPPDIPTSGHTSQEVRPSAGLHVCPSSQVDHSGSGGSTTLDLPGPYGIPFDLEFLL
ncbi:unnamed protein product [Sphagnum tenellum]